MSESILTAAALNQYLNQPDWRVFDARFSLADPMAGERAYQEGHIPGAIYAHLDRDLSQPIVPGVTGRHPLPEKKHWEETLKKWGLHRDLTLIVYDDQIGGIAARLWWMLRWSGFSKVMVLDGGWQAWVANGYPINQDIPIPGSSAFIPEYHDDWLVPVEGVERWRQDPAFCVVDSREAIRYRGEQEPIDPVAGHIPGAVNLPFGENMTSTKAWKSVTELHDRFSLIANQASADRTVFYCGSGVTACHNILAYHQAGLGMPRLYAGSWSHWITDAKRPVALGENP